MAVPHQPMRGEGLILTASIIWIAAASRWSRQVSANEQPLEKVLWAVPGSRSE